MTRAWQELASYSAATLCEAQEQRGIIDHRIQPLFRPIHLVGPAYTVEMEPGDNLAIHVALTEAPAASILVVTCGGDSHRACIGDIMAHAAMARGISGLVTDGMVRDARELEAMGFPVFCRGTQIRGPAKSSPGRRGAPIVFGGVEVETGDYLVGDNDGLVLIKPGQLSQTLEAARARGEREAETRRQIDAGRTTLEIMGLKAI